MKENKPKTHDRLKQGKEFSKSSTGSGSLDKCSPLCNFFSSLLLSDLSYLVYLVVFLFFLFGWTVLENSPSRFFEVLDPPPLVVVYLLLSLSLSQDLLEPPGLGFTTLLNWTYSDWMKKYEVISKTNLFVSTSLLLHQLIQPVVEELVLSVLVTPGLPVLGGSVQRGLKGGSPEKS